jgi:hypothetical protein
LRFHEADLNTGLAGLFVHGYDLKERRLTVNEGNRFGSQFRLPGEQRLQGEVGDENARK